jgi:hypothetical protein
LSVRCGRSFGVAAVAAAVVVEVVVVVGGGLSDCVGVAAAAAVHGALHVSHDYAQHVQLRSSSLHKLNTIKTLSLSVSFFLLQRLIPQPPVTHR